MGAFILFRRIKSMKLTLPDGKIMEVSNGLSGKQIVESFNPTLAKSALAVSFNNQLFDLQRPINEDGSFSIITKKDKEALDMLRHDCSHLMAQAILSLYPDVKFGFGPSIEEGFYYDFDMRATLNEDDFAKIETRMKQFAEADYPLIRKEVSKQEALHIFKDNEYKIELINEIEGQISIYTQGDFIDLCSGPHLPSTGHLKHFKLLSIAGAYWRGRSDNKQLQRIYGTSFFSQKELDEYLALLEERKKRDHRKIGRDLGLFMISEYGPGFPFWLEKGMRLREKLKSHLTSVLREQNYQFIETPIMLSKELWELSGHYQNYRENMYISKIENREFAIKPMNCPGGMLVYKNNLHSYKDLPLRIAELGLVHRHEASGALSGLFRVRSFTQDDAHIYCRSDQLIDEVVALLTLFDNYYSLFGLDYHIEISTRPEKGYIGTIEQWNKSEQALIEAAEKVGKPYEINEGDGAFYGPKIDFKLRDSMRRIWQCGTIQLDVNLPERFDLTYIDENGEKVRPTMLHRAIFGSLERFIGILIEHYAGAFPVWLAPVQVIVLPVNHQIHQDYAKTVVNELKKHQIFVDLDASNEKLGYRLRHSQLNKIPYTLVVGDKEAKENLITYRQHGHSDLITVKLSDFVSLINEQIKNYQ
jgi:threonyl-tRNA synthetase